MLSPRFLFQVPLRGRDRDELWSGLEWRSGSATSRNRCVPASRPASVRQRISETFYRLLDVTEQRNGFRLGRSLVLLPAPVPCDERRGTGADAPVPGGVIEGEVLAAHTMNVVGRRVWYQTGASASHRREVRPSHALQWRMLQDAHKLGAEYYDMRGVSDCLDPEDRGFGLLRWKLGTGGEVVETLGRVGTNPPRSPQPHPPPIPALVPHPPLTHGSHPVPRTPAPSTPSHHLAPRASHPAPRTPHRAPRTPHPAPRTPHPRTPHPAPRALSLATVRRGSRLGGSASRRRPWRRSNSNASGELYAPACAARTTSTVRG